MCTCLWTRIIGNSSPRFFRLSTYAFPCTSDLVETCQLPLALVCHPFADQHPKDAPVPVVDFRETGPPRCSECRSYVNPWCIWESGGSKWKCNLCGHRTEGPSRFSFPGSTSEHQAIQCHRSTSAAWIRTSFASTICSALSLQRARSTSSSAQSTSLPTQHLA